MTDFDHKITTFGIRNRILVFALIVTLTPSLGLGWLFYAQTKKLLQGKAELELHSTINQAQSEAKLWFKESAYNMRVFSNSFVISENLEHVIHAKQSDEKNAAEQLTTASKVIAEYLVLVQSQFQEYQRLQVLDNIGFPVAQSHETTAGITLPDNWQEQLQQNKMIIGETDSGDLSTEPTFLIATPIFSHEQGFLGLLATEFSIKWLDSVINSIALSESTHLSLLNKDGSFLISGKMIQKPEPMMSPDRNRFKKLYDTPMELSTYMNANGTKVVGLFTPLPHLPWGIVMEKNYTQVFAEVLALKNITLSILAILLSVVGIAAFILSYSILSPLKKLINGAIQVADGDLNVKLPVQNRDELGFTISVFNDMVVRLRKNHDELEKLSTVDALTGLSNRKRLMEMFALHIKRYARHQTPFTILMADLDHFKQVNDCYGHLAGDAVLISIGKLFSEMLRSIDTAGRYGGEEFLIILDDIKEQEALQTAERIRQAVEQNEVTADGKTIKVTVSIGVATINNDIDMQDGRLIGKADKALYEAKRNGRNRAVLSTSTKTKEKMKKHRDEHGSPKQSD